MQADHLGLDPLFAKQFECIFRVTHGIVERMLQACGNATPFFTHSQLISGKAGTHPKVRVLMALKTLAFVCSSVTFIDYSQMSTTAGHDCVQNLCHVIANSELHDVYLWPMSHAHARRVA